MKNDFRSIFLNTGIIGISQVILIIVTIARSKISAVLLGPEGMGIIYMISNSLGIIGTITNLGFGTIAIKNISKSAAKENSSLIIQHYRVISLMTGMFGLILTILCSYFLSIYTFNSTNYVFEFIILSTAVLLAQINTGYFVAIQGKRQFKSLAISNIISGILSLIVCSIIMVLFKNKGIISIIFLTSFIPTIVSYYFFKKLELTKQEINFRYLKYLIFDLIRNGTIISLTRFLPLLSSFILYFIMNKFGSNAVIGLYTAGFSIIFNYSNLLFTTIESEYYTRISKLKDSEEIKSTVNFQIELILTFITPIIICFIIFIDLVIRILYTNDFLSINNMMSTAMLGLLFKGISWPLNYIYLLKNNTKKYFTLEFFGNFLLLILNITFFLKFGLERMGFSYILSQILLTIITLIMVFKDYNIKLTKKTVNYILVQMFFCLLCYLIASFSNSLSYLNYPLLALILIYNLYYINKTTGIITHLINKIK
jgi:O-antigen/teichoic acid export membrane protein